MPALFSLTLLFRRTHARAHNICYFSDIHPTPPPRPPTGFTVPTAWSATTKVNYRIKVATKNFAQVFSAHFIPRGLTTFSPKTGVSLPNITYSTGSERAKR